MRREKNNKQDFIESRGTKGGIIISKDKFKEFVDFQKGGREEKHEDRRLYVLYIIGEIKNV